MAIRVSSSRSSHRVVLVADDDAFSQNLVSLLEESGCQVELAVSARMAGSLLERHHNALVILDLNAQQMHAVEFALSLRKRGMRVPTLAISSMPNLAQHCAALRVEHFLAQPFRFSRLVELTAMLSRESRSARVERSGVFLRAQVADLIESLPEQEALSFG